MVNTRRSVCLIPTIALARALRRERRARIAEEEILPQSQTIPSRSKGIHRTKTTKVQPKLTRQSRRKNSTPVDNHQDDSFTELKLNQDPANSSAEIHPPSLDGYQTHTEPPILINFESASQVNQSQFHQSQHHQSQFNQSQAHLSQVHQSQAHQSEFNQSQAHQSEFNQSQAHQSEFNQSQAHQSEFNQSQAHQSEFNQSQVNPSQAHLSQVNPSQYNPSQSHLSQAHLSQVNPSPYDLSQQNLASQGISYPPSVDASQNPLVCSQPQHTQEKLFSHDSAIESILSEDDSSPSPEETNGHPFLNGSRKFVQSSPSPEAPVLEEPVQDEPIQEAQVQEPPKLWFQSASTTPAVLPNQTAPIFQPTESLIHFAPGVTISPETKPFDQANNANDVRKDDFRSACDDQEGISAYLARRRDAITKAATAVMAHMNGNDVSRSDYLSILDGMLTDPEVQGRLPPVLIERYEVAVNEKPSTLYNGGLIDKFVNATQRATNVTARILLNSKNAKRERKARGSRFKSSYNPSLAPSSSTGQYHQQTFPSSNNFRASALASASVLEPPTANQSSVPRIFPESSREANWNGLLDHSLTGKGKESSALWVEGRGVMRTAKTSVRPAPYPQIASTHTLRLGQALGDSTSSVQNKEVRDECGYSVYSASTGLYHQQPEMRKVAQSVLDGVSSMLEPDSYDAQCLRNAEALLEETARRKGKQMAASVRRGFDLLHCYDLVKKVNVDLLSDALLEHISDAPKSPREPFLQSSNSRPIRSRTYESIPEPPSQFCEHAQLGWGVVSYAKVFHPIGSDEHYTKPIHALPLP